MTSDVGIEVQRVQFVVQAPSNSPMPAWKVSKGCHHLQATSVHTSQGSFAPHGEVAADLSHLPLPRPLVASMSYADIIRFLQTTVRMHVVADYWTLLLCSTWESTVPPTAPHKFKLRWWPRH